MAQEAEARQLELEEPEKKRAAAAAERAAWEAEEVKSNLEQWQRLGQEFDRLGMTPEDVASLWSDGPTSSMVAALASLLAGERPDNENIFGLDLGYEICDSLMVDDLVGVGVSLDYVLTGKRSEASDHPAPEWLPLKWLPGIERPPKMLDAACVFGYSEKSAIKDVAAWDGEKWINGALGEPWDLPCLKWFPIPGDEEENNEE